VHGVTLAVDGHGDGHVFHHKLINGLHTQVLEGDDASGGNGFGDEISGAAHGDEVDGLEFAYSVNGDLSALGFAHHTQEAGLGEHLARIFVHTCRSRRPSGADGLVAHGVNGADIIDEAVIEVNGQRLSGMEHMREALVSGVASSEEPT